MMENNINDLMMENTVDDLIMENIFDDLGIPCILCFAINSVLSEWADFMFML